MHIFAFMHEDQIDSRIMYMSYSYSGIGQEIKSISRPKIPYESVLSRNYQRIAPIEG